MIIKKSFGHLTAMLTFSEKEMSIYRAKKVEIDAEILKIIGTLSDPAPTIKVFGNNVTVVLHGWNRGTEQQYLAAFQKCEDVFRKRGFTISEEDKEELWTASTVVFGTENGKEDGLWGGTFLFTKYSQITYEFIPPGMSFHLAQNHDKPSWLRRFDISHSYPNHPDLPKESLEVRAYWDEEYPVNDGVLKRSENPWGFEYFQIKTSQDVEGCLKRIKGISHTGLDSIEATIRQAFAHCMVADHKSQQQMLPSGPVQQERKSIPMPMPPLDGQTQHHGVAQEGKAVVIADPQRRKEQARKGGHTPRPGSRMPLSKTDQTDTAIRALTSRGSPSLLSPRKGGHTSRPGTRMLRQVAEQDSEMDVSSVHRRGSVP